MTTQVPTVYICACGWHTDRRAPSRRPPGVSRSPTFRTFDRKEVQMRSRSSRLVRAILLTAITAPCLLALPRLAHAQAPVVPLWPNGAPGSETWTQKEVGFGEEGNLRIRNVVQPTVTVVTTASGPAMARVEQKTRRTQPSSPAAFGRFLEEYGTVLR